jgi:hypothetical protein
MSGDLAALVERLVPGAAAAGVVVEAAEPPELAGFAALPPERQDKLLHGLEGGDFFESVRMAAIQAMFSRPEGFALLGYPGAKPVWTAEEQRIR